MKAGNERRARLERHIDRFREPRWQESSEATSTALETSEKENKLLGAGVRMEIYAAQNGGRKLYMEFRRDINCKQVFFWNHLRDVLVRQGFDITGGFSDQEWAMFPFAISGVAGSVLVASKTYGVDQLDAMKTDVQAMFDLWSDAEIEHIAATGAGTESNADILDVAMMSVA